jgi:hypothetical protein
MSALEVTFVVVGIASFAATGWVCGIVAWRILRGSRT